MQMSDSEICRSYREAKDKRSQVGVLAELNACSKDYIREILQRNGIDAPKPGRKAVLTDKAKKAAQTRDCKDCAMGETCGGGKPDGVRCDAFQAKDSEGSKMSTRLLKSEESENVGTCQQNVGTMSEVPEADGSERKQAETRVPDFVISIAVQKLEDMTKELNELMEYADTLKAQINELRHWISVATEGEEKKEGE